MGTKGREIVGVVVDKLIEMMNKALADEWLAYYQYWIGAKVVRGRMSKQVIAELDEHAADELRHAVMLTERILELDGTPILDPAEWNELTNCGYEVPKDFYTEPILKQNIKGEQCAIDVYNKLINFVHGKHPITYNIVLEILTDEVEHEDDLQTLLEDLQKKMD